MVGIIRRTDNGGSFMCDRSSCEMVHDTEFEKFWLVYLRAHTHPGTRVLHYCAAGALAVSLVICVLTGLIWPLPVGIAVLCTTVSLAHLCCERNHAYLQVDGRPVWSLLCFCRMTVHALLGELRDDLSRVGLHG